MEFLEDQFYFSVPEASIALDALRYLPPDNQLTEEFRERFEAAQQSWGENFLARFPTPDIPVLGRPTPPWALARNAYSRIMQFPASVDVSTQISQERISIATRPGDRSILIQALAGLLIIEELANEDAIRNKTLADSAELIALEAVMPAEAEEGWELSDSDNAFYVEEQVGRLLTRATIVKTMLRDLAQPSA